MIIAGGWRPVAVSALYRHAVYRHADGQLSPVALFDYQLLMTICPDSRSSFFIALKSIQREDRVDSRYKYKRQKLFLK